MNKMNDFRNTVINWREYFELKISVFNASNELKIKAYYIVCNLYNTYLIEPVQYQSNKKENGWIFRIIYETFVIDIIDEEILMFPRKFTDKNNLIILDETRRCSWENFSLNFFFKRINNKER